MATLALGAAVVASNFMQNLWYYNRENYMFDVPLKQNMKFQKQNINISRYGLFREDVRDLAALTTDKVESYLIVNTLKLGFIVTLFFNYDRTDTEMDANNFMELHVNFIFSVTLCTALFWLFTSIWYSMHAIVIAQSFMTKMLLQVVRIPLPRSAALEAVSTDAAHFEKSFAHGLRLPWREAMERWWNRRRAPEADAHESFDGAEQGLASMSVPTGAFNPRRSRNTYTALPTENGLHPHASSKGLMCGEDSRAAGHETLLGREVVPDVPLAKPAAAELEDESPWALPSVGFTNGVHGSDDAARGSPVSVTDLIHGCPGAFQKHQGRQHHTVGREPHTKLFRLLGANWSAYDLHSNVSMVIGTSCMLSGMSYYALYYFRGQGGFQVDLSGWFTFGMLAVLARWSLLMELNASKFQQTLLTVLMIGGPIAFIVAEILHDDFYSVQWLPPVAMLFQTMWVQYLCWSGMPWKLRFDGSLWCVKLDRRWPPMWRASHFLNVLHQEHGPAEHPTESYLMRARSEHSQAISTTRAATPRNLPSSRLFSNVGQFEDGAHASNRGDITRRRQSTGPMLNVLGAILVLDPPLAEDLMHEVKEVRSDLYAMGEAAGVDMFGHGEVEGFWLRCDSGQRRWVGPGQSGAADASEVSLDQLIDSARELAENLYVDANTWNEEDMKKLALYGGDYVPSTEQFEAQFHHDECFLKSRVPMGRSATYLFSAGVIVTTCFWTMALACSVRWSWDPSTSIPAADLVAQKTLGERVPLRMPRSWLAASTIGCDANGSLVLADPDGLFVHTSWQSSPSSDGWSGPRGVCEEGDVLAADFGPPGTTGEGALWEASATGFHPASAPVAKRCGPAAATQAPLAVTALALDSAPRRDTSQEVELGGLVVQRGELRALERAAGGHWRLAGRVRAPRLPDGRAWSAVALLGGRAFALQREGALFELKAGDEGWVKLLQLDRKMRWSGLCALPGAEGRVDSWLALGHDPERGTPPEFWRFARPGAEEL